MSNLDKYRAFQKNVQLMRDEMRKMFKGVLLDQAQELFKEYPKLESFSWSQYTPHFNDGNICVFGVNADDPKINGSWEGPEDWTAEEICGVMGKISKLVYSLDEEDFRYALGDHLEVTIYPDRIETEECCHD